MSARFGNIASFSAIVVWSFFPLLVTFCADVPLFLLLAAACLVTFGVFVAQWVIAKENVIKNLLIAPGVLVVAVIGNGGFRGLYVSALLLVDPVEAALINYLWPMILVILGLMLAGSPLRLRHYLGIAAGLTGVLVLVSDGKALLAGLGVGHAMAMASAFIWGAYVALAQRDERIAGNAVPVAFLLSAIAFLGISALIEQSWVMTYQDLGFVVLLASSGSLGTYLWGIGVREGDGRTGGLCSLFMPLLAALWLVLFDVSALDAKLVVAALLVFAAAALVSPYVRRRNILEIERLTE